MEVDLEVPAKSPQNSKNTSAITSSEVPAKLDFEIEYVDECGILTIFHNRTLEFADIKDVYDFEEIAPRVLALINPNTKEIEGYEIFDFPARINSTIRRLK